MTPIANNTVKTKKRKGYVVLGACLLTVMLTAACSDSSPSDETIKNAILQKYAHSCHNISISEFQKINGFLQSDGSYIADAKFTLVMNPSPGSVKYVADYHAAHDSKSNLEYKQLAADSEAALSNLRKEFSKECSAMDIGSAILGIFDPYTTVYGNSNIDSYAKVFTKEFTWKGHFIKSDNGWVLSQ